MTNLDKLLARGAQIVGGDLILRHKVMGQFRNGDFFVTEEGLLELDVVEVVAVEVKEKPAAKKAKKAVEAEEVQETPESPEGELTIEV